MSLGARATKGGAKAGKDGKHAQDKGKGPDKPQPKEKVKPQATTEQLRMANMIDRKSEDATDVRRMVLELMEMTCRTEEEVCSALHDSDNDMVAACNLLLEESQRIQGEWQTSEKKKKKPPAAGNGDVEPRARAAPPRPRRGEGEGGRGGASAGPPPGDRGGPLRGARGAGRGGRGGRAGRRGGRAPRPPRTDSWPHHHGGNMGDSFPATEDWDNEEWSGSLSDTKVFTPSASAQNTSLDVDAVQNATEDWDAPESNGPAENIPTYTYHNPHHPPPRPDAVSGGASAAGSPPLAAPDLYHHQPMGMSGSLSAAQSQYLSQLTQQSQRHDNSVYSAGYGVYGADVTQRKPPRARVPPPSKIPSSAVEMPGGGEVFLDVQFGALETDTLQDTQSTSAPESTPAPSTHEVVTETSVSAYSGTMLSESVSASSESAPSPASAEPAPAPPQAPPQAPQAPAALEKISGSMKQLSVEPAPAPAHHYHPRAKSTASTAPAGSTAAASAAPAAYVTHHPAVYGGVYPQVNSTNASLTGASMSAAAYPSSVTLTQYQPIINSYQQTSSSAAAYGGSALYTAAPYYHATHTHTPPAKHKDHQYESSVASSNSLTNTSTTQTSTAKVTSTTNAHATQASASSAGMGGAANAANAANASSAAYAATTAALYTGVGGVSGVGVGVGVGGAGYAYDEAGLMRTATTLPHHMGGYYEVGYGAREGSFGLGAGDRFGRTDAASPQQVPAALPPGYAYFYQPPPPTTYQYGVYPTYGGGSNVGGVGSGAGGKVPYTPQQPPYDAQDSYKQGGAAYSGGSKGGANDINSAIYKTHVALNKVNSYEKAGFHSGTPPPFGASHLYIPAPHHHQPQHHHHQMDARVSNSHSRRDSGASGGRGAATKPAPATKPAYSQSYWTPN